MKPAPILKYPGSKWKIADWIISHFPPHETYLEPFLGSGAVFFNKPPSKVETINDIDGDVVNLFKVIREQPEELARLIEFTPWARNEYIASYEPTDDPLEKARRFIVRCWQAHGTKLGMKTGWRHNIQTNSGGISNWCKLPKVILQIAERLKHAQIENQPAIELIKRYRYKDVLIYADPPYILDLRTKGLYKHEMTDEQHTELIEALLEHPGPVVISGYDNDLYDSILKGWHKAFRKAQTEKGKVKQEVIWMNFDVADNLRLQI